jgi:hypothetical protein
MRKLSVLIGSVLLLLAGVLVWVRAQDTQLAATMEVLEAGVEVRRANTEQWIAVQVEAIVGVGDYIRTNETGQARITFFADGTDTDLLPNTEYTINQFEGDANSFVLEVAVLAGQTTQRLQSLSESDSSYTIVTPGMGLVARGTAFAIRVEADGRSAMLVSEGAVDAAADDEEAADGDANVPPGFGIRAAQGSALSDVVAATTFEGLDAALDGCTAAVTVVDDVSYNVRSAPNDGAPRVGTISAAEMTLFIGRTESSGWYRLPYRGGFGWVRVANPTIGRCAGLRVFPNDQGAEDVSLYDSVGDPVNPADLEAIAPATAEAEPTAEATAAP